MPSVDEAMESKASRLQRTQWAAQFAVASELCKRGYHVGFTMGHNTPFADLFAVSTSSGKTILVDVKGLAKKHNFWNVEPKTEKPDLFYILAYVPKEGANSFAVISQKDMNLEIANFQKDRGQWAKARPAITWKTSTTYKDKWETLPS